MFHNDLTRYRDVLQFFSASYEKPPDPVRYPGLKIFTPLSLRSRIFSAGGCLPKDNGLYADLIAPETVPRLDGKIQLESKADMKRRKLPSPNRADALALTFAYPVSKKAKPSSQTRSQAQAVRGHDPFARFSL